MATLYKLQEGKVCEYIYVCLPNTYIYIYIPFTNGVLAFAWSLLKRTKQSIYIM